jgi:energy-coupling factor transporter ATP-binding protein EcfA2
MPVTRSNIDEIKIQNFKFFPKLEKSIKVGGNHVLLYGENGSGKSSIYWALYTLMECANKEDVKEIQKYFEHDNDERLINIYLQHGTANWVDPFVEVTLKDGSPPYRISLTDTAINSNTEAQESNLSSDFINYRNLLSLYNFAHSEDVDLIHFFNYAVFPYVKFPDVKVGAKSVGGVTEDVFEKNSNKLFKLVNEGPPKSQKTKLGKDRFPKRGEQEYTDYKAIVDGFRSGLEALLRDINTEGNVFLKDNLGYNFGFELSLDWQRHIIPSKRRLNSKDELITAKRFPNKISTLKETDFSKEPFLINEQEFLRPLFQIWLKITDYENEGDVVRKPHSFLNEARLTALGLSIRLAVLKRSLSADAKLKILVLDDLLISLDMSNREKVLELVLKKYHGQYQLFILTHDMSFFQVCKRKIEQFEQTNWVYYEMYADEDRHIPVIQSAETNYSKAWFHLRNFDYPASGNYFRKAAEEIFKNDFPREVTISDNGQDKEFLKNHIDSAIKFYDRIGVDTGKLKALDNYLFLLLNPLSHRDVETDIYRYELDRIRKLLPEIIAEVKALNFRELTPAQNNMVIRFRNDIITQNEYFIKTVEPIYIYQKGGQPVLSNSNCKSIESLTIAKGVRGAKVKNERFAEKNIVTVHQKIYERWGVPYDNSYAVNIFHEAFNTFERKSLQQLIEAL